VIEASQRLMEAVAELDGISKTLVQTERQLEPLTDAVEDFMESYMADLWDESVKPDGPKFPPEQIRTALAHRAIDKELYARYRQLVRSRIRAKQRLSDLREIVAAQRSIVSAAKMELEASEGPQPAWSK
jgi:phage-related minor tail protein